MDRKQWESGNFSNIYYKKKIKKNYCVKKETEHGIFWTSINKFWGLRKKYGRDPAWFSNIL